MPLIKSYSNQSFLSFVLLFFLVACSNGDDETVIQDTPLVTEDTTTTTSLSPVTEDTTTTTSPSPVTEEGCILIDNSSISLETAKQIQTFLYNNGFDPGPIDGYLGSATMDAIKQFQANVGLEADGDVGLNTINEMRAWTGCEDIIIQTSTTTTVASTTTTTVASTTTTTVASTATTTTTTTTLPSTTGQDVGYQAYISPENGNITSILRSITEGADFCSSATFSQESTNKGSDVGLPDIYKLYPSAAILSSATTQLTENSTNTFEVTITGNGDSNYKYYFIEPFTATYKELVPSSVSVSSGLTVASFSKSTLKNGYWFYGYADNGTGGIVKSEGVREFLAGSEVTQVDLALGDFERIWLHTANASVANSKLVNTGETVYLTYLLSTGTNTRSTLKEKIDATTTQIVLNSGQDTAVGDVLIIHDELLLSEAKPGAATLTVERGYRNTVPKSHQKDSTVREVITPIETNMAGVNGYAVFKGETGYKFAVSLGREGVPSPFLLTSDCPNGVYSLDYIKVYGWREKGNSVVENKDMSGGDPIASGDSFTLVGGDASYISPKILSANSATGAHLNTGPKGVTLGVGSSIDFNFAGVTKGSKDVTFVELEFILNPLSGASKSSSTRKIIFSPNNGSFNYSQNISSLSSTAAFSADNWEKGYKYTLKAITIGDGITKMEYGSSGILKNLTKGTESTHDVYYLDQYIFTILNS